MDGIDQNALSETHPNQVRSVLDVPQGGAVNAALFEQVQGVHIIANCDRSQGKGNTRKYRLAHLIGQFLECMFEPSDILRITVDQIPDRERGTATSRIDAVEMRVAVIIVFSIGRLVSSRLLR